MATNYPTGLDSFINPTSGDTLDSPDHAGQHADANDAIEALQAKVGVDGSSVTTSLDYKVDNMATTLSTTFVEKNNGAVNSDTNPGGIRDTVFTTNVGSAFFERIVAVAIQQDNKILLGSVTFGTYWNGTTPVGRFVRLNTDGTLDTAFTTNNGTGASSIVYSIKVQSNGQIIVGGGFTLWNGTTVNGIVRLNSDGTRDTAFTTNTGTGNEGGDNYSLALQPDGKVLVGGTLILWNGTSTSGIVRLNSDGTLDTSFTTNIGTGPNDYMVYSLAVQSDGKILVGGQFTSWNGTTVGRIVRLNSDGTRDTAFSTNISTGADSTINSIAVQSDGKILVGGNFSSWNGTAVGRIVRLNSDGARDTSFTTNTGTGANSNVHSITVQSDGSIIVGGAFNLWNGTTVNGIVRLNSDGTRDTAFTTNTGTGADSTINSIAVQSDGKMVLVGEFTAWDGVGLNYIVRISGLDSVLTIVRNITLSTSAPTGGSDGDVWMVYS